MLELVKLNAWDHWFEQHHTDGFICRGLYTKASITSDLGSRKGYFTVDIKIESVSVQLHEGDWQKRVRTEEWLYSQN